MSATLKVNLQYPEKAVLAHAADVIRGGGIIVYPTETLYGIGADASNPAAILRVFKLKKRKDDKPVLVIINYRASLEPLVRRISESADQLIEKFWPGPLTMVFDATFRVPDELTQGGGKIGVRIPSSELCLQLLKECGSPITSTSANVSGGSVPRTISKIEKALGLGVDLYLGGGELPVSKPSTVVDVSGSILRVLREGAIPIKRIQKLIPNIQR